MKRLRDYAPPGRDAGKSLGVNLLVGLLLLFLFSLPFWFSLSGACYGLYTWECGERVLMPGRMMPELNTLLRGKLLGLWGFAGFCGADAVSGFLSFRRPTKSLYVMKRLPDRWELPRRCLTLPALSLAGGVVLGGLFLAVFTLCYYWLTPAGCLPAQTGPDLWRALIP